MPSIQFLSTTAVQTWSGADLSQIGPIYPMVGSEFILYILGLIFWLAFHFRVVGIENREMKEDEDAARSPERLNRVFAEEAEG